MEADRKGRGVGAPFFVSGERHGDPTVLLLERRVDDDFVKGLPCRCVYKHLRVAGARLIKRRHGSEVARIAAVAGIDLHSAQWEAGDLCLSDPVH